MSNDLKIMSTPPKFLEAMYPPSFSACVDEENMSERVMSALISEIARTMRQMFTETLISGFIYWKQYFQKIAPFLKWNDALDDKAILFMISRVMKNRNLTLKDRCLLSISKYMLHENFRRKNYYGWKVRLFQYKKIDNQISMFQERFFDAITMIKDDEKRRFFCDYIWLTSVNQCGIFTISRMEEGEGSFVLYDFLQNKLSSNNHHGQQGECAATATAATATGGLLYNKDQNMSNLWTKQIGFYTGPSPSSSPPKPKVVTR